MKQSVNLFLNYPSTVKGSNYTLGADRTDLSTLKKKKKKKAHIQNGVTKQCVTLKKDYNFQKDMIYTRQVNRLGHHI